MRNYKPFKNLFLMFMLGFSLMAGASEKVYLHFDQTGYFLNETMWFKAYVIDMQTHVLTEKSKVLYVELLAPEGYVVDTRIYKLHQGKCEGCIPLPQAILSGFYEVRAYTRYMLNWGEENYFSRVFPVFDSVHEGDYGFMNMLERNRKYRPGKERNDFPDLQLPESLEKECNPVNFLHCDMPEHLQPFQKVELTLKGSPYAEFSLSVSAEETLIFTDYTDNIHTTLFLPTRNDTLIWQGMKRRMPPGERHFGIMKGEAPYIENFERPWLMPEKTITLVGHVGRKHFRFGKREVMDLIPSTPLMFAMDTPETAFQTVAQTDSMGFFSLTIGDFHGNYLGNIRSLQYKLDSKGVCVCIDRWFSPPPRMYDANEVTMPRKTGKGIKAWQRKDADEDIRELPTLIVKNKKRRRRWREVKHSLLKLNVAEEIEWMIDNTLSSDKELFSFLPAVFRHYGYPSGAMRILELSEPCPGDSVIPSHGILHENPMRPIPVSKTMIIRTDPNICKKYSYSNCPPFYRRGNVNKHFDTTTTFTSWSDNSGRLPDRPNYVVCFEPFTKEEKGLRQHLIFNNDMTNRYTYIRGFTAPMRFRQVDYSLSHPQTDYRRTLYWNPTVRTDENGIAKIIFYNNSTCRTLHVSAEGISGTGILFYIRRSIPIEKESRNRNGGSHLIFGDSIYS